MNKFCTRFCSYKQEKIVAKKLLGRVQPNSGATPFQKGDVKTEKFLIECKTCMKERSSINIKKCWLTKLEEERFGMGKDYSALCFDFGDNERFYIIDESLMKQFVEYVEKEQEN